MQNSTVFKTKSRNSYIYSPRVTQVLLSHPVLTYLLELGKQGEELTQWLEQSDTPVILENGTEVEREQLEYYAGKYSFLLEHGYFEPVDLKKKLSGRLTGQGVKSQLANSGQLTFEVTESCNLNCHYCGYGKLYNKVDPRTNQDMDFAVARKMVDYMVELWNSDMNVSHNQGINISFYGGEPLLNFSLIESIIGYLEGLRLRHNYFYYSMTSNGLLVEKYMDFLVKHRFHLHISLDGDESHHGYRVFHNGKSSHERVVENIEALRAKYPAYFEKCVEFISVLHNKNSVSGVLKYIREKFNKRAMIVELNPFGIDKGREKEFWETYKNYRESLNQADDACEIRRDQFIGLPEGKSVSQFLTQYSGFSFDRTAQLLQEEVNRPLIPTATCVPFWKKIFITVDGKILPCERIDHKFFLGKVNHDSLSLDFDKIAALYNKLYDRLSPLCRVCYLNKTCTQCMFNLPLDDKKTVCPGCSDQGYHSKYMSAQMSILEENPGVYKSYMEEVTIS